ncbi:hypothetical protein HD599_003288 [Conyzicola lurida]|uniref:Uncharacterized protein n=1 Tax=Conyzicola lurida TaxID=1172621 RepID=A0A841ATP9_9MICO|nr:hypothetical protein [Conyzicola lurida]
MPISPFSALGAVVIGLLGATLVAPAAASAAPGDPPGIARVAAVFPLTTPESRTALLSATTLESYTSASGILTRDLEAVIDTPVAIGIDPMILASIRVLGTAAPQSALDWLDRLGEATNETFALTYADSDITVALQAGAGSVLGPTSFDFAVDPARFAAASATATPDPAATPDAGGAPALPTTQSLLDWDYSLNAVAWPVAGTVVATDIASIGTSGFTTTILSSGNVDRSDDTLAHATVNDTSAVVTDDTLSDLFDDAINAPTLEDWQSSAGVLQAAIDATAATGSDTGATVLLAVDRESLGSASRLGITMSAIETLASSDVAGLSSIVSSPPAGATLVETPQTAERVAAAQSLLATEVSDSAFATVAANPLLITGERRLRLLATLSTAWNSYPGGWGSALTLFQQESVVLHESVQVVQSSDITLVADRASLPVTVSNALGQPVTVNVSVTAPTPILEIEEASVPVTIEPDSQKRAQIPVQSLSNGTADISVIVYSTAGVQLGEPTMVRINVYAGWETPITVALGILVFIVFGFGVARTIIRRRNARREAANPTPVASAPSDAESDVAE